MTVNFFAEGLSFKLPHPRKTSSWIKNSIKREKRHLTSLSVIFCTDEFLLNLNKEYLGHGTLTDIITFDYSETPKSIAGEIYISLERVKENALKFQNEFEEELDRVIIHGILHLVGYNDKTSPQKREMREKEEAYLSLR